MLVLGAQQEQLQHPDTEQPAASQEAAADKENAVAPELSLSPPLSLEARVRRLEDIIAGLQLGPVGWNEATIAGRPPHDELANGIVAVHPHDPPPPGQPLAPAPSPPSEPWLLVEVYAELRAILRMFFDPRYYVTWKTRLLTVVLVAGIVLSRLTIAQIWLIGWLLDFVIFPILLYILFKVLSREATRYRRTAPDLPLGLRL
jgi:hypothetical protein